MIIVGLTGSIGMGKSTVAQMFAEAGAPAYSSDTAVHELYAPGGAAVAPVEAAFPGVNKNGGIDRGLLSQALLQNPGAFKQLEAIVHPLVRDMQIKFLRAHNAAGTPVIVLDIPLLLENDGAHEVDKVVVVSAPAWVQKARVMGRPGMSEEKFAQMLSRQMPDAEKRKKADYIIDTGVPLEQTRKQVRAVLDAIREQD